MAWFFQSSTEPADHWVVVGRIDNKNRVGASDLPTQTRCDFPPLFPFRSRAMLRHAPALFRIQHHLSDWPDCVIELQCCGGSAGLPVRLLMQRSRDITFGPC
jgi:hypothetical protein